MLETNDSEKERDLFDILGQELEIPWMVNELLIICFPQFVVCFS